MKSQSTEDYLKAIYQIQEKQNGKPVSTSSLAAWLGVKDASVTEMVKRFSSAEPSLVTYEPYGGVTLTGEGEKIALEVIRHHRLIESYLSEALGYSWDEVHAEADRLEHVISEDMEERMARALGNPAFDPHGDPIPDRDGNLSLPDTLPLTQLEEAQPASIRRVIAQRPEVLRYLSELGLTLSTRIQVVTKAPFRGPLTIKTMDPTGPAVALDWSVAEQIFIQRIVDTN